MSESPSSKRRFENIKFLYVDDEADNLASFRIHYDDTFDILAETDPINALQTIRDEPDLAVLIVDQVMPKMSGREFADSLLQVHPNTKLLFVSGYADDVVLQTGLAIQETPFLQKPYSLRQLGNKVQELLSIPSRADD